jgi:alpha-glucosidase
VPLPWEYGKNAANGFSPNGKSWLPQPLVFADLARDQQEGVPGSTLETYKWALAKRKEFDLGNGAFEWAEELCGENGLAYRNGQLLVIHNFDTNETTWQIDSRPTGCYRFP